MEATKFSCSSEVGRLTRVLVKHPREAFRNQTSIEAQWRRLRYTGPPELGRAVEEYDRFLALLESSVLEFHYLPNSEDQGMDSIYVRDSSLMTPRGAVIGRMGKRERRGEPPAVSAYLEGLGVPVLGGIAEPGTLEGGDVVVLDDRTMVVGEGYRTNAEGIRQLKSLTADFIEDWLVVPLPHWNGPGDVLHLMSLISPVDTDLAVVFPRLLPVFFRTWLLDRGIRLIEVPDDEFESMGCNVLALAPRKCVMLSGNPQTRARLEEQGAVILEYDGEEISRKGAGGPTCLTRPLFREDARSGKGTEPE